MGFEAVSNYSTRGHTPQNFNNVVEKTYNKSVEGEAPSSSFG